jgi:PKD repeat protein
MTVTAGGESASDSTTVSVDAPPIASFAWTPTVPQPGANVTFSAANSSDPDGSISSYAWDFNGDGHFDASGVTTSRTFPSAGTVNVTLRVTDNRSVTDTETRSIRINAPPTAAFNFAVQRRPPEQTDPFTPILGQSVGFSAAGSLGSSDSDGTIVSYEWDFNGDGVFDPPTTSPFAVVPMNTPGDVRVGLRVTDNDGATNTATRVIHVDQPPVPSFTFSPPVPQTGQTVQFTSTTSDPDGSGDIVTQSWDFNGDDSTDAVGPTALATFLTAGTYTVTLTVQDRTGAVRAASQQVTVVGAPAPAPPSTPGGPVVVREPFQPPASGGASGGGGGSTVAAATASGVASRTLPVIAGVRVSIAGSVESSGTHVTRLFVIAPRGAVVRAACTGKGCPAKRERRRAAKSGVRLRKFERTFRGSAKVAVSVTKSGFIGKYILFTFRRGKAPVRTELCLAPGARAAARCPAS